eukprot:6208196-Pleurochrysis_carterae.AAC.4
MPVCACARAVANAPAETGSGAPICRLRDRSAAASSERWDSSTTARQSLSQRPGPASTALPPSSPACSALPASPPTASAPSPPPPPPPPPIARTTALVSISAAAAAQRSDGSEYTDREDRALDTYLAHAALRASSGVSSRPVRRVKTLRAPHSGCSAHSAVRASHAARTASAATSA